MDPQAATRKVQVPVTADLMRNSRGENHVGGPTQGVGGRPNPPSDGAAQSAQTGATALQRASADDLQVPGQAP